MNENDKADTSAQFNFCIIIISWIFLPNILKTKNHNLFISKFLFTVEKLNFDILNSDIQEIMEWKGLAVSCPPQTYFLCCKRRNRRRLYAGNFQFWQCNNLFCLTNQSCLAGCLTPVTGKLPSIN